MVFASPLFFLALLTLPALAALEVWATRRDRERTARLVARPLWVRVLRRPPERWRFLRLGLLLLGTAGVVLALARPQWGIVREKVEREGVDVVLALDTSGSMATEDVPPNRMFLAKAALLSLVSQLEGDRFGLLAFEGEAYPLVPLTLDADAVGLFLESVEPGIVPSPGTSLGAGLARGLGLFVDPDRRNKVLVLVSDGEDLEGEVEEAVGRARAAGVVVHTVGVGTEAGQPVPDFDREGRRVGFKKDAAGSVVVSRLNMATLESIARGTGGRAFRITSADTSLSALASAIEGMERKALAGEFSYRRKERFQVPLAVGLLALALGLTFPLPSLLGRGQASARATAAALLLLFVPTLAAAAPAAPAPAGSSSLLDEVLMRPRRLTARGQAEYDRGNHPEALSAFEGAAGMRPQDPRARFNLADALYRNGKFEEAEALFRALGEDSPSPLAPAARFNLGNARYQRQDYRGAIQAYRDALHLAPEDAEAKRNLELALRALKKQQEQKPPPDRGEEKQKPQGGGQKNERPAGQQKKESPAPETPEQKQEKRFREETGMPRERAMQLLDALKENEKNEQRKLLNARRAEKKRGKDW
ncbi:MAG TPA: tetratricopeptide repeat protein [Vicinamibacteria bacterium]|nr:tetratricopeptide repeat protein [Vicinamibacteria bacterium]